MRPLAGVEPLQLEMRENLIANRALTLSMREKSFEIQHETHRKLEHELWLCSPSDRSASFGATLTKRHGSRQWVLCMRKAMLHPR